MSVACLIVAAGRGARAASDAKRPKQYLPLGGEPMLTRTIGPFAAHDRIDDIQIVIHPDDKDLYTEAALPFSGHLLPPAMGGAKRQDSVRKGLEALADRKPDLVLIHDAARPFVDRPLIDRVIDGLSEAAGALPGLPVTDTLKRGENGHVRGTVPREGLWQAQTPQGFKFAAILEAHRAAGLDPSLDFTDDTSVAEWFGLDVVLVEGRAHNRKLTTVEDLRIADDLLRGEQSQAPAMVRVGTGYDVHALGPGDSVILCGVRIAHTKSLVGHSDADVGLHALTDALLGTIADGDIGTHFPPSDARWRGARSDQFLKDARDRIHERGGKIVNVDVTLLCETPRIGPHRDAMRAAMASVLEIDVGRVSVKATTNEALGFVGRQEGIAALATAAVMIP